MDTEGFPGYLITQENNPIRWLQEMVDTTPMQLMTPGFSRIADQVFALGDTWPVPRRALVQLAATVHGVQIAGYGFEDETMSDLQEIYQFLVRTLNQIGGDHERRNGR
jgi:hypothetical protein